MSKSTLKKHLQLLTKEQIIEQVLDVYENSKPAKAYFEYVLNPNENEQFEKYKSVIVNEFYPNGRTTEPKTRFAVAKKAISDFRSLKPSEELIGDLMVTLVELACKFTYDYGDMWEQYYDSTFTNFKQTLLFLEKNNLLQTFRLRCQNCVKYSSVCGYGFADAISSLFYEYYE